MKKIAKEASHLRHQLIATGVVTPSKTKKERMPCPVCGVGLLLEHVNIHMEEAHRKDQLKAKLTKKNKSHDRKLAKSGCANIRSSWGRLTSKGGGNPSFPASAGAVESNRSRH